MYGMMDAYMRTFYKEQQNEEYISRYLYSSEYAIRLDSLSAQQLADYYRFITAQHQDAFEQYVCQSLYRNADFFKDMIVRPSILPKAILAKLPAGRRMYP